MRHLLLIFALAGLPMTLIAQDGQIVIEDLSAAELRAEIQKVQTEFFRVFNISNTDDSLEIVCHTYVPTMSHISQEACEPQFLIEARARNVEGYRNNTDELLTPEQLRADQRQGFERLTEAMNSVLRTNDYFRELNSVLQMLRGRLAELNG
ncbi:MAG: hypothetical protein RL120_07735 [Gammaproteobacteria bacterium]